MRLLRLIACLLVPVLMWGEASAQDLVRMFLPGDPQYQLMGGNPFAAAGPGDSGYARTAQGSRPVVRYDRQSDNYYKELRTDGTSPSLDGRMQSLTLQLPLKSGARVGLAMQSRQLISEARNTSDQLLNYENTINRVRLSYETPLSESLRWAMALGHSNASAGLFQDAGTSISLGTSAGSLSVQADQSSNAQDLNITVAGVQGLLPLDNRNMTVRVGMESGGSAPKVVLSAFQSVISPLPGGGTGLHFLPAGYIRGWESRVETQVTSSWKGMVSLEGRSFSGSGTFTAAGSQYGLLRRAEYTHFSATAGVMAAGESGSMAVADFTWMRMEGTLEGYAESWPFISAMQSLFSARGSFQAAGSFQLTQLHAGGLVPVLSSLEVGGGITAMRITPALRIESWQPGFLGVGRKGYADRRLAISHVDGAMVSSGLRLHAGRVRIDYSISQFVPIRIQKSGMTEGTADLFVPAKSGSVIRSSGGLFQRMSVEVEL